MKKIGVMGQGNIDFILYLSSILKQVNNEVVVKDLKKTNEYQSYIKEDIRLMTEYSYNDIDFYFTRENNNYKDVLINNYDISEIAVLPEKSMFGNVTNAIKENDFLIILCEQRKVVIDYINQLLSDEDFKSLEKVFFIDKDFIDSKTIPSKIVRSILDEENKGNIVKYQIPFDEVNFLNKINLQYDNKILFKISKEYAEVLKLIVLEIFEGKFTEKEVKSAIKRARKGV